jgi:hypothetical protein
MEIKHIIQAIILLGLVYFILKIYRKRICNICGIKMIREVIENQIVYKCTNCVEIKETGVYLGANDS